MKNLSCIIKVHMLLEVNIFYFFFSDLSAASGSEYHPKCSIAPSKQKRTSQSSRQQAESVAGVPDNESSSDSSLSPASPVKSSETSKEKSKLNLKAIFAYHFRGKKFKAAAHRKYKGGSGKKKKKKYESTGMPTGRPPLTASPQEQKRRLLDRGFQFPFVEKHYGMKHIPLKMVLGYEVSPLFCGINVSFLYLANLSSLILDYLLLPPDLLQ